MIRRVEMTPELSRLAEPIAAVYNEAYQGTGNYRPIEGDELIAKARADRHFLGRLILVAEADGEVEGCVSVEPVWQPNVGGDIYPYAGGEIVFQPSLLPARGDNAEDTRRRLLREAKRALGSRGKTSVQMIVPEDDAAGRALLMDEGFEEIERMVSLRAEIASQRGEASRCTARQMLPQDVAAVMDIHNSAFEDIRKLHKWEEMTADELAVLGKSVRGYDKRGMIVAEWRGHVVGYVTAMIDPVYNAAHGTRRGFIGFSQMGLAVSPRSQGLGVGRTLMLAASASLLARGCCDVELITDRESDQAMGFYRALGFTEVRQWPILEAPL
ncbi:MAG: GNAT family N-acetyltransferase [Armatimonadota bacterium]|jgi:ribosomal protein S18 acetylase RimI-like enzyme